MSYKDDMEKKTVKAAFESFYPKYKADKEKRAILDNLKSSDTFRFIQASSFRFHVL